MQITDSEFNAMLEEQTMRKYQLLQDNYEARLKADMVAVLDDLQLEIEEHLIKPIDNDAVNFNKGIFVGINEIQEKIDKLKEDKG